MSRPRIGITTSYNDSAQQLDHAYIKAVEAAGGLPLIVPMLTDPQAMAEFATLLDGLLMVGGPGITRGLIGSLPDDLAPVDPIRDRTDQLIYSAFQHDVRPVLGICYGMQFINAQAGGTIYGDVMAQAEGEIQPHSPKRGGTSHPVQIAPNSALGRVLQTDSLTVNTYHLQALASVGDGLQVNATSPDGVIEGIETPDGRMIGVQFHPERMTEQTAALFADFIARARR